MVVITIIDGSFCCVSRKDAPLIKDALGYKNEIMITVKKGKRREKQRREVISYAWASKTKTTMYFWRGVLRNVIATLKKQNVAYTLAGTTNTLPVVPPILSGITLREYQNEFVNKAVKYKRGVILSATATGKSAIISGIIAAYTPARCLVVCHLVDVILQLKGNIEDHLGEEVAQLTTERPTSHTRITVVTIQTLGNIDPDLYRNAFDVIIIDETHLVSKLDLASRYARVFANIETPHRFGFTGTLPTKPSAKMALNCLVGPVIGTLGVHEAITKKIIAKPKLILLKVEKNVSHTNIKSYKEALFQNVISNSVKNKLIIDCATKLNDKGLSVLILVSQISHGDFLQDRARAIDIQLPFVCQETSKEERLKVKLALNNGTIMTAIGSNIFKVGIDIPNLGAIIIAGGGKSQVQLIQSVGRGLRRTTSKEEVIIVDFLDTSCHWIATQFAERLAIYFEQKWIGHTLEDI